MIKVTNNFQILYFNQALIKKNVCLVNEKSSCLLNKCFISAWKYHFHVIINKEKFRIKILNAYSVYTFFNLKRLAGGN